MKVICSLAYTEKGPARTDDPIATKTCAADFADQIVEPILPKTTNKELFEMTASTVSIYRMLTDSVHRAGDRHEDMSQWHEQIIYSEYIM